jgi:hypothetical protein
MSCTFVKTRIILNTLSFLSGIFHCIKWEGLLQGNRGERDKPFGRWVNYEFKKEKDIS